MRKFSFKALFFVSLFSIIFYSCTSENIVDLKDHSLLNSDKVFIELVEEMTNFTLLFNEELNNSKLNLEDVQKQLTNISELSPEEQMLAIDNVLNSKFSTRLKQHMEIFSKNWKTIKNNYGNLSSETLQTECAEVLNLKSINFETFNKGQNLESRGGCGWKYTVCITGAAAAGILCHAGCEGTAIVATAGLGVPACVLLCVSVQAAASLECNRNYCNIQ